MTKSDILNIEFPQNENVRILLNVKHLSEEFIISRSFEKTAAILASRFSVNLKIASKLKTNPEYFITWQKLCSYLFSYLLGPAKFLDRTDANELVCLPITTKIIINNSLQTIRAINVYNTSRRIGTLFFKDPEFNNEFSFYGINDFKSFGSWASKVRTDVQNYNLYGLNTDCTVSSKSFPLPTAMKSLILESATSVGSTITIKDLFSEIDNLKRKFNLL